MEIPGAEKRDKTNKAAIKLPPGCADITGTGGGSRGGSEERKAVGSHTSPRDARLYRKG